MKKWLPSYHLLLVDLQKVRLVQCEYTQQRSVYTAVFEASNRKLETAFFMCFGNLPHCFISIFLTYMRKPSRFPPGRICLRGKKRTSCSHYGHFMAGGPRATPKPQLPHSFPPCSNTIGPLPNHAQSFRPAFPPGSKWQTL